MPGIAWAALVVWGALTGSALLGPPAAWKGVDPMVNRGHYRPTSVEYHTWTSSPRVDKKGDCTFMVFALATRERPTRLRINGMEQLLDWSWSWEATVPQGHHADGLVVEFMDPVGGKVLSTQDVWATCPWKGEGDVR